jgi:hypothetical protein
MSSHEATISLAAIRRMPYPFACWSIDSLWIWGLCLCHNIDARGCSNNSVQIGSEADRYAYFDADSNIEGGGYAFAAADSDIKAYRRGDTSSY